MNVRRTWDIHYNIKWFYLDNIAVCCNLSVLLWRYPDDGRNSDRNVKVINNIWQIHFTGLNLSVCYMNLDILSMHGYGTNYVKTAFLYLNGQSRTADERLSSDIRIGRVTEKNRSEKKKSLKLCRVPRLGTDALLEDLLRNLAKIMKPQVPCNTGTF